jgi:hypothetical protein
MTKLIYAAVAFASLTAATAVVQPAEAATEYPWCAQYGRWGGGGRNCGFTSYRQCMATVSGIGGFCVRNEFYPARRPPRRAY